MCCLEVGTSAIIFQGQGWTKGWGAVAGGSTTNKSEAFLLAPIYAPIRERSAINHLSLVQPFLNASKFQDNSPPFAPLEPLASYAKGSIDFGGWISLHVLKSKGWSTSWLGRASFSTSIFNLSTYPQTTNIIVH
jgi:hypothetical protein